MNNRDYILYVDDNEVNLRLFAEYLSDTYEVVIENSTQKAWESLNRYPIKVIVSDQRMPEEEGLVFLDKVNQTYPEIIKILCTAYVDENSAIKAINQGGIFHYIVKPYSYEYMREIIKHAVNEYNLKMENKRLLKELQRNNSILQQAFNQIKEQQLKLFTIFDQSNEGIVIIRNGEVLEANPAFRRIFSIHAQERILMACTETIQKNYSSFLSKLTEEVSEGKSFEYEIVNIENKKRYLEVQPSCIDFLGKKAILAIIRDITERREAEYRILEAITTTQENEQRRYARELHDGIGPLLSTIKMYVEWLTNPQLPNPDQMLQYAIQTIDETIRQTKNLANQMSPHLLERFGLIQTLYDFLEQTKKATAINYQLSNNLSNRLPSSIEITIYRILLEAINNTLKYANADNINIEIKILNNEVSVKYSDNGKGFDLEKVMNEGKGMGLFNMHVRVQALKGQCKMFSSPGAGFSVEILLPINE
ncbi:MAG: response regulator [Bacteroidales bacterium]|nr:response regulator [Bacteroidales bacterium]